MKKVLNESLFNNNHKYEDWAKGIFFDKDPRRYFHPYTKKDFTFDYDNRRSKKQAG